MHPPLHDATTQLADRYPTIDLVCRFGSRVERNIEPMSDTDIAV